MSLFSDLIMVFIIATNVLFVSSSRIFACIKIVALQSFVIGVLSFMVKTHNISTDIIIFGAISIILKSFIFPWLLFRAQRQANIRRDVEPLIGYSASMIICVALFIISSWISLRLPLSYTVFSKWVVPVSFSTILTGALILVSRTKALTQVLGYLIMENGIYTFGLAILPEQPLLVELAILLDIFVAVFVMGITIFHISREFDHIDTQHLSQLKDWDEPADGKELIE